MRARAESGAERRDRRARARAAWRAEPVRNPGAESGATQVSCTGRPAQDQGRRVDRLWRLGVCGTKGGAQRGVAPKPGVRGAKSLEQLARGGPDELCWRKGERDPRSCGKCECRGQRYGDAAEIPSVRVLRGPSSRSKHAAHALPEKAKRSCW
jgi:hypothetical protein